MTSDDGATAEKISDPVDFLESLTTELTSLLTADLTTAVSDCPGWTLRDLMAHVGRVYAAVTAVIEQRAIEPVKPGIEAFLTADLDDEHSREWFRQRVDAVLSALRSVEPSTPLWTWSNERTAAFYRRRMVHETAIHLADAARATGRTFGLDRAVCVDGIDEYFDVMLPFALVRAGGTPPSGSLHLHCTDGDGEWLVVPEGERLVVTREHAKGDVAWRGPARALVLAVWGRVDPELDVVGDQGVSAEWLALAP